MKSLVMKVLGDYGTLHKRHPDCPKSIPMSMLSEEWAQVNHGQTLSRLNERGGLSPCEMVANIERRKHRVMPEREAIDKLKQLLSKNT